MRKKLAEREPNFSFSSAHGLLIRQNYANGIQVTFNQIAEIKNKESFSISDEFN